MDDKKIFFFYVWSLEIHRCVQSRVCMMICLYVVYSTVQVLYVQYNDVLFMMIIF